MLPAAPGLVSITTGWPRLFLRSSAMRRATMSVLPPAEKPTTMVIWRFGQDWAEASAQNAAAAKSAKRPCRNSVSIRMVLLQEQVGKRQRERRYIGYQHQRRHERAVERPDGAHHVADRHPADGAADELRRPHRRGVEAERAVDEHQHAELHRAHAVLRADGQEYRRADEDGRRHVEKGPQEEKKQVDQEEDHPGLARDPGERAAGDLRDLVQRYEVAERAGDADEEQDHASGLHRLRRGFQKALPAHAAV